MDALLAVFSDWPHLLLLGGAMLGGALVGIGIIKDSKEWTMGAILVLIGVIIEPILTLWLFMYDENVARGQQSIIARQEAEIQPRQLKQDKENAIIRALSGFEFKKVAIVSYAFDVESSALVAQIIDIAYHSHLNIEKRAISLGVGGAFFSISITGSDKTLVDALLHSFESIGHLEVTPKPVFQGLFTPGTLDDISADALIFVGAKPLPK